MKQTIKLNESQLKQLITETIKIILLKEEDGDDYQEIIDFTDTPEFKNWFANSKIIDKNGNPLPVYHGSPVGGITQFKNKDNSDRYNNQTQSSGLKEFGICFSTNVDLATKYRFNRKLNPEYIDSIKVEIEKLKNIRDNVRNNREYEQLNNDIKTLQNKLNGGVYQTYLKMENPYIFDAKGKDGYYGWKELKVDLGYKTAIGFDAIEALSGHNSVYKSNYDGIIAKNIIDIHLGGGDIDNYKNLAGDVYMVFSPSQTMIEKEI
jgi:hypothetical protein